MLRVETNLKALSRAKMEVGLYKYVGEVLIPNPSAQRDMRKGFGRGRLMIRNGLKNSYK